MRFLPLMVLAAGALRGAGISDTETTVLLHSGDSLIFQLQTWTYAYNAARFGLSADPAALSFTLVSAPTDGTANLSVWLNSVPLAGPLSFSIGQYSGSTYQGPVSVIQAFLRLTPSLAQEILGSGDAELVLRNDGSDLLLGLPPNSLLQDVSVSLTGGPLTVAALTAGVSVDSAPEPASAVLVLLPLLFGCLKRQRRGNDLA